MAVFGSIALGFMGSGVSVMTRGNARPLGLALRASEMSGFGDLMIIGFGCRAASPSLGLRLWCLLITSEASGLCRADVLQFVGKGRQRTKGFELPIRRGVAIRGEEVAAVRPVRIGKRLLPEQRINENPERKSPRP